jgi:hypothetical protein
VFIRCDSCCRVAGRPCSCRCDHDCAVRVRCLLVVFLLSPLFCPSCFCVSMVCLKFCLLACVLLVSEQLLLTLSKFPRHFLLPLSARMACSGLLVEKCRVLDSKQVWRACV